MRTLADHVFAKLAGVPGPGFRSALSWGAAKPGPALAPPGALKKTLNWAGNKARSVKKSVSNFMDDAMGGDDLALESRHSGSFRDMQARTTGNLAPESRHPLAMSEHVQSGRELVSSKGTLPRSYRDRIGPDTPIF